MSNPGQLDPMQKSHDLRAMFEQGAYFIALGIITATACLLVFGIAFPPPVPDVKAVDWGASIVARCKEAVPVLFMLLGALGVGTGITLTRGHMDAKLDCKE